MDENHTISFIICIIVSAIVLAVICSCSPKPEPKTWIEIQTSKSSYSQTLRDGTKMFFNEPEIIRAIELQILISQWKHEDEAENRKAAIINRK